MARALRPAEAAWPLLACFGGLLLLDGTGWGPAADAPWRSALFLAVLLLAFGALLGALRRLGWSWREEASELSVGGVLVVALLLRLLALPLTPSLSDDVHRYLWDGRVAAAGANPYRLAPNAPELSGLRDDLWQRTAHRDVPTVYPPLALGVFAAASALPQPLVSYKLALVAADLIGCALLLALARRRGSIAAALAYVWNPLVVIEGAGMGHVDVLGASLVIGCVYLIPARSRSPSGPLARFLHRSPAAAATHFGEDDDSMTGKTISPRLCGPSPETAPRHYWRSLAAGALAALAVLAKLLPLAALPLWWRKLSVAPPRAAQATPQDVTRPDRSLGRAFAIGAACLLVPATAAVLVWTGGVPSGLTIYALRWEYNGPLYEPLWRLFDVLQLDHLAAGLVHALRFVFGGEVDAAPWHTLYSYTYPQFLTRALLLAAAVAAWLRVWRQQPGPVGAAFAAFGILLLASPTLYPWYLIWILPWAALLGVRSVLMLSATLPLAYLPALAGVDYFPWVYGAVWLPPLLVFVVDQRRSGAPPFRMSGWRTR